MASALASMKVSSRVRDAEVQRRKERERALLVLISRHLCDHGYLEALQALSRESGLSLAKVDAADNVHLLDVLLEFEEYHEFKFGRRPKLTKKGDEAVAEEEVGRRARGRMASSHAAAPHSAPGGTGPLGPYGLPDIKADTPAGTSSMLSTLLKRAGEADELNARKFHGLGANPLAPAAPNGTSRVRRRQAADPSSPAPNGAGGTAHGQGDAGAGSRPGSREPRADGVGGLGLSGSTAPTTSDISARLPGGAPLPSASTGGQSEEEVRADWHAKRVLKPLPYFGNPEMRDLATTITRDILVEDPDVPFSSVAGLLEAKRLLRESVVMPIKYPEYFQGILTPWKGVLLYGPPGTGKTMLAKAVATECRTTFFNISASSIVSKWRGDSEKLVRVLFELARYHAPSTIFIDEFDSLMGDREGGSGGPGGGHEGSLRMKTELLVQMDGLNRSSDLVFVLAASNLPWALDKAVLRRLEKRILVPLPDREARRAIVSKAMPQEQQPDVDADALASATEGYSGADVFLVCKEAAMRPLRRVMERLEALDRDEADAGRPVTDRARLPRMPLVTPADVDEALRVTKPSAASSDSQRYDTWAAQHGSTTS